MLSDKERLIHDCVEVIRARDAARRKGLIGKPPATKADWMAWEGAKSELGAEIIRYALAHDLQDGLRDRWLNVVRDGDRWVRATKPVGPAKSNRMLIGQKVPQPDPSLTLSSAHVPTSNIKSYDPIRKPTQIPKLDESGYFGGVDFREGNLEALLDEFKGLPDEPNKTAPALDTKDLLILTALKRGGRLMSEQAIANQTRYTRTTVRVHVSRLIEHGFVHRPNGSKGGAGLTAKGQKTV